MWFVLVFSLAAVFASRVCASSGCTPGVHASVWNSNDNMNQYIRVNVLQDLMRRQNDPKANFVNLLQPRTTNGYFAMSKEMLEDGNLDVFSMDIVYTGQYEDKTADLRLIPEIHDMIDSLDPVMRNAYTHRGKMNAFPLYKNTGILVYRKDLLRKHGFDVTLPAQSTFTWERFQEVAEKVMNEERKTNPIFLGYAWQGMAYEGLTCNLMEWLGSDGFVHSIVEDGKITMHEKDNTEIAKNALERARNWLKPGNISHRPEGEGPLQWTEDASVDDFLAGNSLFLRIWTSFSGTIQERARTNGLEVDATYLPRGKQFRAGTLGAFGVALANMTRGKNKCRKNDSIRALRWVINKTASREYFKYGYESVYNLTYANECANESSENLICSLHRYQGKIHIVERPYQPEKYQEISEKIFKFVNAYLQAPEEVRPGDIGADMADTTIMWKRLSCALNRTLGKPAPTVTAEQCDGDKFQSPYERRNTHANLWPGDKNCENNFNFISPVIKTVCLVFCSVVYLLCAMCAVWIGANLSHIVVNRSQPIFLYMVLFGVALNISTIVPLVMDESWCASPSECQDTLNASCRSIPFVYGYGFFITFGSLLVKLWRVEKIFNNKKLKRIKITVPQLLCWVGCLLALVTVVNVYWAFFYQGGLSWYRVLQMDASGPGVTGSFCEVKKEWCEKYYGLTRYASVGYCGGGRTTCSLSSRRQLDPLFLAIYCGMELLLLAYSIYIGYITRDIDTSFAEGRYITISIVNQFQLVILGLFAFNFVSQEQYNTNTVALVSSCILCFGNLSTLALLFVPKFIAMRKINQTKKVTEVAKRDDLNSYLLLE